MSTGVSDHQRSKGPGNSSKIYNKFPNNGPKDHHGGDHEDVDSWRSQQQHHQGYASSMGTSSDPYMNSYYNGGFQYQAFGVGEGGPWSTNAGEMPFLGGGGGGYSGGGMHDSGASGHYNVDGMFAGGNGGGGGGSYGNFGGQPGPGFGYGFHGNGGDYNTWGQPQPRKHYDDFYGDERGVKGVEQSMGGLGLGDKDHGGLKDLKDMMQQQPSGGGKKTTWASIASQPAKPQSLMKKKPGMPPPPIIPGTWENKNGSVAKAPIAAPVQAPHPPAWERPKLPPSVPSLPPAPQGPIPGMQSGGSLERSSGGGRGYQQQQQQQQHHHHHHQPQGPQHQGQMGGYNMASHQQPPAPVQQHQQQQQQHNNNNNHSLSAPLVAANNSQNNHSAPAPALQQPAQPAYPDELKIRNDYNPREFDLSGDGSRFFVIKSYSEDDIHRSIKYEIWCSTEHGNNRLDQAFREREGKGPIYLFFSVNGSGHFCGMAQMISAVDKDCSASVWSQDKWKGQFKVKWVYVKDVPNTALRHIKLENNENKPVTNSRDTQEVPFEKGKQVLKILHTYPHTTSIFDDFIHYEKRQEEEDQRRVHVPPAPMNHHPQDRGEMSMQHERGGGRGGRGGYHNDRGHHHGGGGPMNHHHQNRGGERDFSGHRGDNPRDLMRDPRDGRMDRENHHRGGGGGPDRDGYGGGRPFERDFHPRDRDGRPGGRGVPRGMPRN